MGTDVTDGLLISLDIIRVICLCLCNLWLISTFFY